jgi:hypothetical protein
MSILNPYNATAIAFAGGDITNPLGIPNGSAAAPGLYLTNSPTTGFYRIGANILGIATAGAEALRIDSSKAAAFSGTVTSTVGGISQAFRSIVTTNDYVGFQFRRLEPAGSYNQAYNIGINATSKVFTIDDNVTLDLLTMQPVSGDIALAGSLTVNGTTIKAANLPTVAGASGTLWVDTTGGLNIVKRVT